jgi:hypothetical protein
VIDGKTSCKQQVLTMAIVGSDRTLVATAIEAGKKTAISLRDMNAC